MTDDLDEIIQGCLGGDRSAQRTLYERYCRRVYRLALRMVGRQDAADVTQEVFLRVFAGLANFRGHADFSTWLYRVAVNECLLHLRRRPDRCEPLAHDPVSQAVGPERRVEQAELLERAIEQLDEPLRVVFLLREVEGLSYDQIAAALEIPPGTVASQLSRARASLRAFLRRIEEGA